MKINPHYSLLHELPKTHYGNSIENIKETSNAIEPKKIKQDDFIHFDIKTSEEFKSTSKQSAHKFSELDLIAMLKKQGLSVQMILEILKRVRLEKEAASDVEISVRGVNDEENV